MSTLKGIVAYVTGLAAAAMYASMLLLFVTDIHTVDRIGFIFAVVAFGGFLLFCIMDRGSADERA